jgi:hypothetical protein
LLFKECLDDRLLLLFKACLDDRLLLLLFILFLEDFRFDFFPSDVPVLNNNKVFAASAFAFASASAFAM